MTVFGHVGGSFLPDGDYVPLAMPTTDLGLLWLLTREGDVLRRYGRLGDVLQAPAELPADAFRLGLPTADARGAVTGSMRAGLFAGLLLGPLGGKGRVDLSHTAARAVEYTYTNVEADAVHLTVLDAWLATACFSAGAGYQAAELLVAERLYVVTGVLKAGGLITTMLDERGGELAAELPSAQDLAAAGLTAARSTGSSGTIAFHGDQPLVIAAKAVRLHLDESGLWVSPEPVAATQLRGNCAAVDYMRGAELRLV